MENIISLYILPCIYSFVTSIAYGIQFNIRKHHIFFAALGGIISKTTITLLFESDISVLPSYFFATCAITLYSEILAKKLKAPINMYLVISLIPLVPGGEMYEAMLTLVDGNLSGFLEDAVFTLGIAGSIAMGVFAVSTIFRVTSINKKSRTINR